MPILLIVYHSLTGGTLQMAQAFQAGAAAAGEVEVRLQHASATQPDTAPGTVTASQPISGIAIAS